MSQAKDMITLVNQFAANVEEKKGSITEDEVCIYMAIIILLHINRLLHSSLLYSVLVLLIQSQG